jgi:hypothetical protein
LDSHPVADSWRVGFAPQARKRRLRIMGALARIRPSFFGNRFFSPRLATTDLPGDNQSMNRFLNT